MQSLNHNEGITFIVVSHDTAITRYAERIYHLKMGKIEKIVDNPISKGNNIELPEFKKVQE